VKQRRSSNSSSLLGTPTFGGHDVEKSKLVAAIKKSNGASAAVLAAASFPTHTFGRGNGSVAARPIGLSAKIETK
jgi:hypothetical protein